MRVYYPFTLPFLDLNCSQEARTSEQDANISIHSFNITVCASPSPFTYYSPTSIYTRPFFFKSPIAFSISLRTSNIIYPIRLFYHHFFASITLYMYYIHKYTYIEKCVTHSVPQVNVLRASLGI